MKAQRKTQIAVSAVAAVLAVAHVFFPDLAIDATTLFLLAVAVLPWLLPLFKSMEFPGGWKIEFQELQDAGKRAEAAGLLDETPPFAPRPEHSFQIVADEDANLALVGLRIDIERRLGRIAENAGLGSTRMSVGRLLKVLCESGALTREQTSVLSDMVGILNAAAHGAVANHLAAQWALDVGPKLLATLEKKAGAP